MKWKQFGPIWPVVFLLAPSIWIHRILMATGAPPGPGSPPPPPLLIPFGVIYFGGHIWHQLAAGDFGDALTIFMVLILPIIIYTFFVSLVVYYCVKIIRRLWLAKIKE